MFKILIVENNQEDINTLKTIIHKYCPEFSILMASNYSSAVKTIEHNSIHLFLINIDLGDDILSNSGFSLGHYIRTFSDYQYSPIFFFSSDTTNLMEAVNEIHCYKYFKKPYDVTEVIFSIRELSESSAYTFQKLCFKDLNGVFCVVPIMDILHIEASKKRIILQTNTSAFYTRAFSLSTLLEKLPDGFIQCHKSHIIHSKYIQAYDKTVKIIQLRASNPICVPVGRVYKNLIEQELMKYKYLC